MNQNSSHPKHGSRTTKAQWCFFQNKQTLSLELCKFFISTKILISECVSVSNLVSQSQNILQ